MSPKRVCQPALPNPGAVAGFCGGQGVQRAGGDLMTQEIYLES